MAVGKTTCKCATCGNEFEARKRCYNSKEATSWAEWAAENYTECSECYYKRINAEKALAHQQAFEQIGIQLPDLNGTERQVAWALQIRDNALYELCAATITLRSRGKKCSGNIAAIHWLNSHVNSTWWIENREYLKDHDTMRDLFARNKSEILSMKEDAPQ